tara:strand:+ start:568 stop:681 length:114 start_codon:yes stop_codon:yes gene_type:complete
MRRFGGFIPIFAWAGAAIRLIAAMAEKNFIVVFNGVI